MMSRIALLALGLLLLAQCSRPVAELPPVSLDAGALSPQQRTDPRLDALIRQGLAPKSMRAKWIDPRTPEQLAQQSCLGPGGKWLCPWVARTNLRANATSTSSCPACTVPHWAFDPANLTSCASDSNSCSSKTCGASGIGPCVTHDQIVGRFGTSSPIFPVAVDETQLSDQASPWSDVVQLTPNLVGQGSYQFIGTLLTQLSGTIAVFTPANKSAGTPARMTMTGVSNWATACGGSSCRGMIVTDSTHPAVFQLEKDLGGGVAQISQPTLSEFPTPVGRPAYVTIANGDSITLARQTKVDMGNMFFSGYNSVGGMAIFRVFLTGAAGPNAFQATDVGYAELAESRMDSINYLASLNLPSAVPFLVNDFLDGLIGEPNAVFWGGAITNLVGDITGGSFANGLDGGVLVDPQVGWHLDAPTQLGDVYLATSPDLDGAHGLIGLGNYDTGAATLWGPAGLDLRDGTVLTCYGGCSANLLLTGTLSMHGQTTAYPWIPGSHAYGPPVTINVANIASNNGLVDPLTGDKFLNHP